MVWDAERRGVLKPGKELIEPTSGNTGIALAFVAAARGYPITLTMPETMSLERRKVLEFLGAKLVLTRAARAWPDPLPKPRKSWRRTRSGTSCCSSSKSRPTRKSTCELPVPRSGTIPPAQWTCWSPESAPAGRLRGVSRYFKKVRGQKILSVGVEPTASPVITQRLAGQPLKPGPHNIQGIGAGFIPETLDLEMLDRVELVSDDEAMEMARRLAREEGILTGISCGAAVAVAVRLAQQPEFAGKNIVVILPDAAERYLSTALFEG